MREQYSDPTSFDVLRLTTGGEEEQRISDQRDEFFETVLLDIGFSHEQLNRIPTEVVSRDLGAEGLTGFAASDNRFHYLVLANEVVAIVFDRRNDQNFHEVTFWRRSLSDLPQKIVDRMLQHSDRSESD